MAEWATPNTAKAPAAPLSGTPADVLKTLNPQPQAVVAHGRAPLLVLAGAGSGKTLTLAARVARLVLAGADPQRLLLTLSRRAAQEMSRRAGWLLHQALGLRATQAAPSLPWAGTFHAWNVVTVLNVVDGCMPSDLATTSASSTAWATATCTAA